MTTQNAPENGEIDVPWNLVVPEADIYIVGYGNRMPNDLTLEALAVLKKCRRVFGIPPINAPEFGIPKMESLWRLYSHDKPRRETYQEWLDLVLDAAAEPPVALATSGSAMVGALVTHRILEEAPRRGLTVHVSNAASFVDGLLADCNIEPFFGLEMWEATAFVRLEITPNVKANLLLPQAPLYNVTTGVNTKDVTIETSSMVSRLRDHLLKFYPPEHRVHFVWTGSGVGATATSGRIESLALAELDHPGREAMSTLLVPRIGRDAKLDFEGNQDRELIGNR